MQKVEFFEKKIRPVLVQQCYRCHSAEAKRVRGGLLLDTKEGLLKGGDNGPSVVPGRPKKSLILQALRYEDDLEMPPSGKLSDRIIADFEKWIADGAVDPRAGASTKKVAPKIDLAKGKQFWSFQKPQSHPAPAVSDKDWPKQKIDHFVLARLEKEGLTPTVAADKRKLIRRVTFDLTGLPPTPQEVEAFVKDKSSDAYKNVVDRLLASPHYGERWARMWLDVARYAEDQAHIVGNNRSLTYPNAYIYRDWVIKALNEDVPYDQFVKLQLAADLVEPGKTENLPALGYIGLGPKYYQRGSLAVMADEWEDRVDVVGRGLLGLTVACARCHDHKYDPIPTTDYYALAGVFASTQMYNRPLKIEPKPSKKGKKGKKKKNSPDNAMHIVREGKAQDLNLFIRGDVKNKGPIVQRRFLSVLSEGEPEPFTKGSGRLELAERIASKDNPLTARVIVNRVWALNFGQALVSTPSNFGTLGQRPTHPELLDDLASRFMENGWSLKWLQREIVLSATYQQSSIAEPKTLKADEDNEFLGRMNRRRLSIESWRDAMLAVCGTLDRNVGGKSINPQTPKETRRTLYSRVSRLDLNPMLATFDFPDPNAHSAQRASTTTPLQKMFVLNSPFMVQRANDLSARLLKEVPGQTSKDIEERVRLAYRMLYAREPGEQELRLGKTFVGHDPERWKQYSHVLLASNEMLYID
ncbi:MAG: PSD1 and planctomycete cytochrome C domain-containing protein [Gemmataceae bacterium]